MLFSWGRRFRLPILLFLAAAVAFAQDERRVLSPDTRIGFRLFVAPQQDTALFRIAYQVYFNGKRLIDTSFLGVDLWDQEPLLGENDGLIAASSQTTPRYNSLIAKYMQNGSLGRRLDIEVRVYDNGVAFRYIIPRTNAVEQLLIADESTEFAITDSALATVTEVPEPDFPAMHLSREDDLIMLTRLDRHPSGSTVAFKGVTPLTLPWRVIGIGPDHSQMASKIVSELGR